MFCILQLLLIYISKELDIISKYRKTNLNLKKNDTPFGNFTSKHISKKIQARSNLLRRHYRLLSKGTMEEEAGRISRKSQLQKHDGQGRHAASQ